jgi:Ca2+-binding EF-hand superfamily protein
MEKALYHSLGKDDADHDHQMGSAYQKWLSKRASKAKLGFKDKLHDWRTVDFLDIFLENDKGGKGYLNSKEQRKLLTDAGITMMKTFEIVKQDKYMNFEQISSLLDQMLPQDTLTHRVMTLFQYYDRQESSDGRLTGFVHQDTLIRSLTEHGVSEEDMYIFISPFKRNDHKIEYHRVIEQLYPDDLPPSMM